MRETYNNLEWEIDEFPIGSSTPDDLFEYSYPANTVCPSCGNPISGTANYWSRDEDGTLAWLNNIHYHPCEYCEDDDDIEDEF